MEGVSRDRVGPWKGIEPKVLIVRARVEDAVKRFGEDEVQMEGDRAVIKQEIVEVKREIVEVKEEIVEVKQEVGEGSPKKGRKRARRVGG